ncbi:hypothetical protein ALC57_14522 [Trachymyrmex cornetzi]|uniref:Uncharacterized protein n=1 Tax=Trachymyrmex cornetzi TaxID=471704 RepID=A0A151IY97_9HYME|nr:hypothetical protein ALC57_14522 [Trachymyrmex cornetzi]
MFLVVLDDLHSLTSKELEYIPKIVLFFIEQNACINYAESNITWQGRCIPFKERESVKIPARMNNKAYIRIINTLDYEIEVLIPTIRLLKVAELSHKPPLHASTCHAETSSPQALKETNKITSIQSSSPITKKNVKNSLHAPNINKQQ